MAEFLQEYGLWVALGGVFVAMHWFGMGCCGRHRDAGRADGRTPDAPAAGQAGPGTDRKTGEGCHEPGGSAQRPRRSR